MRNKMAMQVSFRKKQPKALLWLWGDSGLSTTDEGKRRCHTEQNPWNNSDKQRPTPKLASRGIPAKASWKMTK